MSLMQVDLEDKYRLDAGRIYLSGIQALVRLPLLQRQRDRAHNLKTAGFIAGYRGSPALDLDAMADALVGLGRLAGDLGDVLESVDVNPFVLLKKGSAALDGLVVARGLG